MRAAAGICAVAAALAAAAPAHARELAADRLTLGAGALLTPDYEGSDFYTITPAVGALARWHGHNISWKGTSLAIDLLPEWDGQKIKVIAAPFVNLNYDRAHLPSDSVVSRIRARKVALEGGGTVGVTWNGVATSAYDSLTVQLSASHDLGRVSRSFIVTPTVQYLMPVSRASLVGASLSADFVGGRYARYYFGVGPAASSASGLPVFRPRGGLKSLTGGLLAATSLHRDLRKGFALGALVNYERLVGDFGKSPLVDVRGSSNQLIAAVGVGYTF